MITLPHKIRANTLAMRGAAVTLILLGLLLSTAPTSATADSLTADTTLVNMSPGDHAAVIYPPTAERLQLLDDYTAFRNVWRFVSFLATVAILALIIFTRLPNLLKQWSGVVRIRFFSTWLFVALLLAVYYLLSFPFAVYRSFIVEHQFGFSNQTFWQWLGDDLLSLFILMVIAVIPVSLLYWTIREFRHWYLVAATALLPVMIFFVVIAPVFIDPMFNDFEPLKDQVLRQDIQGLAATAGIEGADIFEVNASRQSSRINAYVTGLFATNRIVLYDTLIKNFARDEIAFVMAHEMGHYVMNHLWWGVLSAGVLVALALLLMHLTIRPFIRRYRNRLGFDSLANLSSLPLVLLFALAINFVFQPIGNGISRYMEHQSDVYALEIADVPMESAILTFDKLSVFNLSDPDPHPLIEFWFYSHPSLKKRMEFVRKFHK